MTLATDDILAIQKLIADYNHIVDAGDGEEFAALFTDDGSLDTGFNVVKGSNELRDFAALVPSMAPGARHMVTNVSIDGNGSDATARLYLQMWSTAGGTSESKLVISGRYEDTLRRDDGRWRFVARKMIPDGSHASRLLPVPGLGRGTLRVPPTRGARTRSGPRSPSTSGTPRSRRSARRPRPRSRSRGPTPCTLVPGTAARLQLPKKQ